MTKYFSSYISGLGDVAKIALQKIDPDLTINESFDGLIIYDSNLPPEKIRLLRFFNNSYVLLSSSRGSLDTLINQVTQDNSLEQKIKMFLPSKRISFRIMFSQENQLISIDANILKLLEKKIQSSLLFVNHNNPHLEFLFLTRSEGISLFGLRLTRQKENFKQLHAGQLRPELANLLVQLSNPQTEDIFLDPFSGYGSIPIERTNLPYGKIIAGEIDDKLVTSLAQKTKHFGKHFRVQQLDATNLADFQSDSIDKIVTDPPWGFHAPQVDLSELSRVLRPNGTLVLLLADRDFQVTNLKIQEKYDILVSGKKASVYKFTK